MKKHKILTFFIGLLALVFIVNQLVSSFYKPITTESATYHTFSDGLKITGIIIRNEILVENDKNGVLHFMIEDGKRVSKNGVIANIYSSESASITLSEIEKLKIQISDIEDILSFNDLDAANLELINKKIHDNFNTFICSSAYGNFGGIPKISQELLSTINHRDAALGDTENFSVQLEALNAKLASLTASLPNNTGTITANESGYFLSKTDGYENILKPSNLDKITSKFLNNLKSEDFTDKTVGKIVSDYEWYIAAQVSLNDSMNYRVGDSLEIHTSVKSLPILSVTVEKINISDDNSDAVIIFACSEMNTELASMRNGPMTVVSKSYSGLKVPKKALRVLNSKKGVYVVSGMLAKFVEVDILYSNDDFIIVKKTDKDGALKLYDQVVVKGRNLYDGKIVG